MRFRKCSNGHQCSGHHSESGGIPELAGSDQTEKNPALPGGCAGA